MGENALEKMPGSNIRYVTKANSLIQLNRYIEKNTKSSLSLLEAKLIAYALSKIPSDATELPAVFIDFKEFWSLSGVNPDSRTHFDLLAEAIMNLRNRAAWVSKTDPVTNETIAVPVSWLANKPVLTAKGAVLTFDPDLAPALLMLKDNYTRYPLNSVMRLTCKYGFALYEYICSMEYRRQPINLTLQQIAELLDATNYNPSDLKKRVILPAIKDICTNTPDFEVTCEFHKTNRRFSSVTIYAERRSALPPAAETKALPKAQKVKHGENWENCVAAVKEQIDYDALVNDMENGSRPNEVKTLDLIVEIMAEVQSSCSETYKINKVNIPGAKVQERFHELSMFHVDHVLDNLGKAATPIRSPMAYIRSALFNAPTTMDIQVSSQSAQDAEKKQKVSGDPSRRELDEDEIHALRAMMEEESA